MTESEPRKSRSKRRVRRSSKSSSVARVEWSKVSPFTLVLLAVVVLLLLSSASAMLANIYAYYAKGVEQSWLQERTRPTAESWTPAAKNLQGSLALAPDHPDYLQSLGRLYSWAGVFTEDTAQLQLGVDYYLRAAQLRPYWPYNWSELAFLKAQMRNYDEQFDLAWDRALSLGQWESKVSLTLLKIGAYRWRELSKEQRQKAYDLFVRELNREGLAGRQALAIVDQYGMRRAWCYATKDEPLSDWAKRVCKRK